MDRLPIAYFPADIRSLVWDELTRQASEMMRESVVANESEYLGLIPGEN